MLRSARIVNFQSVEDVALEFGRLTVIVGPSSSGKSAMLRALRTLARNSSGTAFVTQGKGAANITARFDETAVALERGPGQSTYTLLAGGEDRFPKSGTAVPQEVAQALQMPLIEGSDLTFAFQFDRPFLLAESGSTAAKVIGDLTKVNTLHEAAREANRRRLEATSRLKVRRADAAALRERATSEFADLPHRKGVLGQARDRVEAVRERARRMELLRAAIDEHGAAAHAEADLEQAVREAPDIDAAAMAVDIKIGYAYHLRRALAAIAAADASAEASSQAIDLLEVEIESHEMAYVGELRRLGRCPLCDQEVH